MGRYDYLTAARDQRVQKKEPEYKLDYRGNPDYNNFGALDWTKFKNANPVRLEAPDLTEAKPFGYGVYKPKSFADYEPVPQYYIDTSKEAADGDYVAIFKKYVPEPDYEQEVQRAKRQRWAAFAQDLADVVGKTAMVAGKNGAWMIQPTQFRTPQAAEYYNKMLAMRDAAHRDYQGKLASMAIKDLEAKKAAEALRTKQAIEAAKDADASKLKWYKAANEVQHWNRQDTVANGRLGVAKGQLGVAQHNARTNRLNAVTKQGELAERTRHNKEVEAMRANGTWSKSSGNGSTELALRNRAGEVQWVNIPKSRTGAVIGTLTGVIKRKIAEETNVARQTEMTDEFDKIMTNLSEADTSSKLRAIVERFGSEYPGLYEEVYGLMAGGSGRDSGGGSDDDDDLGLEDE